MKTLRMLKDEHQALCRACAALEGLDRASFIMEAALLEAARLGVSYGASQPPPHAERWPFAPVRGKERAAARLTITVSLSTLELVGKAAKHVGLSEPLFLIGAALAYIGQLQRGFLGTHVRPPVLAGRIREKLRQIPLPAQYRRDGR